LYIIIYTEYTDYSVFLSYFIFLTWYQSQCSNFLTPVVFFGVFSLPLPSSSAHYQKQVTTVRPIAPKTLGSSLSIHHPTKLRAQINRSHNSEKNPTRINSIQPLTRSHAPPKGSISQ